MIRIVNVRKLWTPEQRVAVVYVGRAFAGWSSSPWGNPFRLPPDGVTPSKKSKEEKVRDCLTKFHAHAKAQKPEWLAELWEKTQHGALPLGCWCCDAVVGDESSIVCHAQILGMMLVERFVKEEKPSIANELISGFTELAEALEADDDIGGKFRVSRVVFPEGNQS
jgi:hypothetical protein